MNVWNNESLIKVLKEDSVVVMPTDTLYGIVGRARNISVVDRIYELRKRALQKPCIILIGSIDELEKFSIILSAEQKTALKKYWPAEAPASAGPPEPTSIIFDCPDDRFSYLHRGTKTLAFRLPASKELRKLVLKTGPLIAPSANMEGELPAQNIAEAKKYFGDAVDLYVDVGEIKGQASKIIKLQKDGTTQILRP